MLNIFSLSTTISLIDNASYQINIISLSHVGIPSDLSSDGIPSDLVRSDGIPSDYNLKSISPFVCLFNAYYIIRKMRNWLNDRSDAEWRMSRRLGHENNDDQLFGGGKLQQNNVIYLGKYDVFR